MKIYICVDWEGMPGINHWDEVSRSKPPYEKLAQAANFYVRVACEGALSAGATEVWVADSHSSCLNINYMDLPQGVKLVRGSNCGDINMMTPLLDSTFDGIAFLGFHSEQGSSAHPLSHTLTLNLDHIKVGGELVGELEIHSMLASYYGVPTIFVGGDEGLAQKIKSAQFVALSRGIGGMTLVGTVEDYKNEITAKMQLAVKNIQKPAPNKDLQKSTTLEIKYKNHPAAYKASFYPNAQSLDATTIEVKCKNYLEVMRALLFLIRD